MRALIAVLALAGSLHGQQLMKGVVERVDLKAKKVAVANEPIPNGMGAMTMSYSVEREELLTQLKPGDRITAKYIEGDLTLHDLQIVPAGPVRAVGAGLDLAYFEQLALANNPTLGQAQAHLRAATGNVLQAGLYPNPTVGYYGDEVRGGHFRGGRQGGFVSQTIVTGGKLSAARRVAELLRDQQQTSVEVQKLRVLTSVRMLFYGVLAAQRLVEVRENLHKLATDAAETSHQMANIGQADRPDVLQAEVEAQQASVHLQTARQNLLGEWRMLAALVGRADLELAKVDGELEKVPELSYAEWLKRTVGESPEMRLAAQQVARAEATVVRERKSPIPDVEISANLTNNRKSIEGGLQPIGLSAGIQVGVQLPIFNRNQGVVAAARADVESARLEVDRKKLQIANDLAGMFREYDSARIVAKQYREEMLPRAQQAYEMYRATYQRMFSAWPQTLVAQRTLFQLEADYVGALEAAWISAVEIQGYGLTGGLER